MTLASEEEKREYADRLAKWLRDNSFNKNQETYVYAMRDSFAVKEKLKEDGFRFDYVLLWHCAAIPNGYEDKVIKVNLNDIAQIDERGKGVFHYGAANKVAELVRAAQPADRSEWLYEIGERFHSLPVTIDSIRGFDGLYGWSQTVKMTDEEGNHLTWFTSVDLDYESGDKVLLDGTVKKFDKYKGTKNTIVTRCKIKSIA